LFLFLFCFLPTALDHELSSFISCATANTNWQKMRHLGSPANKRCVILRAGMVAKDTKKQIFFN